MPKFNVTASYLTRSGGCSWQVRTFEAPDISAALAAMERRVGKRAFGKLDMRAVLLD